METTKTTKTSRKWIGIDGCTDETIELIKKCVEKTVVEMLGIDNRKKELNNIFENVKKRNYFSKRFLNNVCKMIEGDDGVYVDTYYDEMGYDDDYFGTMLEIVNDIMGKRGFIGMHEDTMKDLYKDLRKTTGIPRDLFNTMVKMRYEIETSKTR